MYTRDFAIDAARDFLNNLEVPLPPEPPLDAQDEGWVEGEATQ